MRGMDCKTTKQILQYTKDLIFVKEWNGSHEIERVLNYHRSNICKCCSNKRKTAHGYIWKWK